MIGQVKTINGVKQIVPLSSEITTVDSVTTGNMNAVTSNAVAEAISSLPINNPNVSNAIGVLPVANGGTGLTSLASVTVGNSTCFDGCTYACAKADIRSGLTSCTGTVTQVKVGTTAYDPISGVISLPAYPSTPTCVACAGTIKRTGYATAYDFDVALTNNSTTAEGTTFYVSNSCRLKYCNTTGVLKAKTFCGDVTSASVTVSTDIKFKGTCATYTAIKHLDSTSDVSGEGILIGAGGLVVVGGGESASTFWGNAGLTAGNEQTILTSDNAICFFTNLQRGWACRKCSYIGTDGAFYGNVCGLATCSSKVVNSNGCTVCLCANLTADCPSYVWGISGGANCNPTLYDTSFLCVCCAYCANISCCSCNTRHSIGNTTWARKCNFTFNNVNFIYCSANYGTLYACYPSSCHFGSIIYVAGYHCYGSCKCYTGVMQLSPGACCNLGYCWCYCADNEAYKQVSVYSITLV